MSEKEPSEGDKLYEKYGTPLEKTHWGEFVAISPDGRTVLGGDLHEVVRDAISKLGRGHYLFKVGEKVLGRIR